MNLINYIKRFVLYVRIQLILRKRTKCATIGNTKTHIHRVDIIGDIVHTEPNGWIRYGCKNATMWCIDNGIYQFDIMENYVSKKDYKLHYILGFVHAEDAMAFKLVWT